MLVVYAFVALTIILVGAIFVWAGYQLSLEAEQEVRRWTVKQGFRLVRIQHRSWAITPFLIRKTSMQRVFWIEVETEAKEVKKGWVRIGGPFGGPTPANVIVEWDWP